MENSAETKKEKLLVRLNEIGASLQKNGNALALLGLGSVGVELNRLDDFSDLDFFVIVKEGCKNNFIDDISWLSEIHSVVFKFKNTKDGYKVMYADGIYCEFAVFETHELEKIPYAEGRIVWKDENFDENLRIPKNTGAPDWKPESVEWLLGEIITCVYVGLCRYERGEKLSGYRFIQGHAFNLLIDLVEMTEKPTSDMKDIYSKERRFEERYPDSVELFNKVLLGYRRTKESAAEMIKYIENKYEINKAMRSIILDLCSK